MVNKDTYLYRLKDGREIVYYGITNNPDRRVVEQEISGKKFTHFLFNSYPMSRETAEKRETEEIQRYQRQHGGKPPKYNIQKTY